MDIFGEFEEEEVVTNTWHFRPGKRADNGVAQMGASNPLAHHREIIRRFDADKPVSKNMQFRASRNRSRQRGPHYMESRFEQATGKRNPHLEQVFPAIKWCRETRFDECGRVPILTSFGIFGPFTHLRVRQRERSLTVNHNREEVEELNEVGQSINEIALHAIDNAAMLISELAALGAFKLHDSVAIVRVSAVETQLRNEISEIIACTQNVAALREQLMGVNAKAERAA
jgi:hypothetical protein